MYEGRKLITEAYEEGLSKINFNEKSWFYIVTYIQHNLPTLVAYYYGKYRYIKLYALYYTG